MVLKARFSGKKKTPPKWRSFGTFATKPNSHWTSGMPLDSLAQTDELLLPPVMQRCNAGFRLEELAHEAAVGEFQAVSNL